MPEKLETKIRRIEAYGAEMQLCGSTTGLPSNDLWLASKPGKLNQHNWIWKINHWHSKRIHRVGMLVFINQPYCVSIKFISVFLKFPLNLFLNKSVKIHLEIYKCHFRSVKLHSWCNIYVFNFFHFHLHFVCHDSHFPIILWINRCVTCVHFVQIEKVLCKNLFAPHKNNVTKCENAIAIQASTENWDELFPRKMELPEIIMQTANHPKVQQKHVKHAANSHHDTNWHNKWEEKKTHFTHNQKHKTFHRKISHKLIKCFAAITLSKCSYGRAQNNYVTLYDCGCLAHTKPAVNYFQRQISNQQIKILLKLLKVLITHTHTLTTLNVGRLHEKCAHNDRKRILDMPAFSITNLWRHYLLLIVLMCVYVNRKLYPVYFSIPFSKHANAIFNRENSLFDSHVI